MGLDTNPLKAFAPPLPWSLLPLFGPHLQIRFHAADDAVIQVQVGDGDDWIWLGARTIAALESTMNCIGAEWEAHIGTKPYSVWRAEQERAR